MIVNKNDLTKLPKVLVTYLGYMSIAFGLALPAYGDPGKTAPETCTLTLAAHTDVTSDDVGNPSSFAAGCGASAGTDGSIAIGEGASVEAYEVTTEGEEGQATHNYDPDGVGGVGEIPVVVRDGSIYAEGANGALIGRIGEAVFEAANADYTLSKRTGANAPDVTVMEGAYGIAIGTKARTLGRESIAIGAEARAVKIVTMEGEEGQATHNYDSDGVGGVGEIPVVVRDGSIYAEGANGALIGRIGEAVFEAANADYTLSKRTGADAPDVTVETPVMRAVAIGADATVTGDNGIAIGSGVTAGENAIIIGGTATTRTVIGGINLKQIGTNTGRIGMNADDIATEETARGNADTALGARIDTEEDARGNADTALGDRIGTEETVRGNADTALGARIDMEETARENADTALGVRIDTNVNDIETNRAGIAMSIAFAHLPSVSAGDKGSWGIGAGSFAGKTALAVGISYRVQTNGVIKAGVSSSGGETSFGVGFGKGF